jgi:hypothetical protein
MMQLSRTIRCLLVGVLAAGALSPAATADEFVDRVNDLFRNIRAADRSDLILLPAVAEMSDPPAAVATPLAAQLLTAQSRDFAPAAQWVGAPEQRAVIEALHEATGDQMAFGQRYGGEEYDAVRLGLYTELGDPETLSAAEHLYLPALDKVVILVNVEAARLLGESQPAEAIDLLIDLALLGRQVSDRAFFEEVFWGMRTAVDALARVRDIAFQDYTSGSPSLTGARCADFVERLNPQRSAMRVSRIRLPEGDYIGSQQIVSRAFTGRGGPNDQFGSILASLSKGKRPLRLFGEAARWESSVTMHADVFQTREALDDAFNDFLARWGLEYFDPMLSLRPDYRKLDPMRHAAITATLPDMTPLFVERQALKTEAVGVRTALAVLGYTLDTGTIPRSVSSVRPRYIPALEPDPYNEFGRSGGRGLELQFFVPARDLPVDRATGPQPYVVSVVVRDGNNFQAPIEPHDFIIYSVGPDNREGFARRISEEMREHFVGDYLIWPPILSLHRRHLVDTGQLR